MSYLTLHKSKILLSTLSVLAGLGFNVMLHEIGLNWHYPVLSLLFSSGLSVVMFGIVYQLQNRPTKHSRPTSKRTPPPPQTNIQTSAWRWEFPGEDAPNNEDTKSSLTTSTASLPPPQTLSSSISLSQSIPIPPPPSETVKQIVFTWSQHKHFLACGFLLAGISLCSVFTTVFISYQWQIFSFEFIFPVTYFIHEYCVVRKSTKQRQAGLIIIAFGGFLNGIPMVLDSVLNGWCGMFAATPILSAILSVYIGYLCSIQFNPFHIAAWANAYLFCIMLLASPLYALTGLQKNVHSFSDLFWYQKQGIVCLTSGSDPCSPYGWAYALAFVVVFSIYFILQAMLTQAEDPSIQAGINSLALPLMAIVYQVEVTPNVKLIYPIIALIVIIIGIVVCKKQTLEREYALLRPYRF